MKHAQSPYDEAAAHRVTTSQKQTLYQVEHPILPINPLFHTDIEPRELQNEIKKLNSDKSPGDDGITNRMIQAGGPKSRFEEILHEVYGKKPPPSVASLHTPSVCTSHPFTLLMWICPLMMMLPSHLIAMKISHLSYFHLVSSQRPYHHRATCLYSFTLPDNTC